MHFDQDGTYNLVYIAEDECGNTTLAERVVEVFTLRTALYPDGTLIINEKSSNQASNESRHGGTATNVYKAWGETNTDTTDVYRFQTSRQVLWYAQRASVTAVQIESKVSPVYLSYWFGGLNNCVSIDLTLLDTSEAVAMDDMFYYCLVLESLDLSNFNTQKVTTMNSMFLDCRALTSLDVSSFDTSNVTDMTKMFYRLRACRTLDLSNFNTSKVTTMESMFSDSRGFESIDLSGFDTSVVTTMKNMFYDCRKLTSLDISDFETSAVTNMTSMFSSCQVLQAIYASNKFDTSSVVSSDNMFNGCDHLVGGAGTTYNSLHVDKSYAHIDGGTSNPGYFTAKA